jgi:betaine-homocysteine S-methyltransferase
MERLNAEGVVCAEGFLFEMERRGYLTAGEFVPELALENPVALENLHRDFQHAGSDIVEAFTYNGHREKNACHWKRRTFGATKSSGAKNCKKSRNQCA